MSAYQYIRPRCSSHSFTSAVYQKVNRQQLEIKVTQAMEYTSKSCSGHVLVLPFPAQGHLSSEMKLVHRLVDHGFNITILTTEFTYAKLVKEHSRNGITITLVPDGLEIEERKDLIKVLDNFLKVMPPYTLNLINNVNQLGKVNADQKITCIISDLLNVWALEIAKETGLKLVVFDPVALGCLAAWLKIPNLVEAGIIDDQGISNKNEEILLSPFLPALRNADFPWMIPEDLLLQKNLFKLACACEQYHRGSDWVIGNWFRDLDPSIDDLHSNILPVGPLLESGGQNGSLWPQDSSCLNWLDKQPPRSVIYVAFGTTGGEKSRQQLDELALGLELTGKPFLWVVKMNPSDGVTTNYPDGFENKVGNRGKMVEWAPQEKVLAHPSVACFLNHCGWNSALESISHGVPMLCWPYFVDHFYNRTCICYGWKIGLELKPDENGIVTRNELKMKVDELLCNSGIRSNALKLKGLAQKSISKGGSSFNNLEGFIAQLKQLKL